MNNGTKKTPAKSTYKKDQENEQSAGVFRKITALTSYQYCSYSMLVIYSLPSTHYLYLQGLPCP